LWSWQGNCLRLRGRRRLEGVWIFFDAFSYLKQPIISFEVFNLVEILQVCP
jgi:hypothetical protein